MNIAEFLGKVKSDLIDYSNRWKLFLQGSRERLIVASLHIPIDENPLPTYLPTYLPTFQEKNKTKEKSTDSNRISN
jgi:hypothetical protein